MLPQYQEIIQQSIPRVFSLLDQNPYSPTYGCFDRTYWHYKMVTDIPSMAYQQLTLVLTLFYKNQEEFPLSHTKEELLNLIKGSILFWAKHQHKEGCFDEWYKNERSFCVTAFSVYAITESILLLKNDLDSEFINQITPHLKKAGYWLAKNKNDYVTNQMAMSLLALHNLSMLFKDTSFQNAYEKRKIHILSLQTNEGWFPEYRGADIGYLSLTLDALAKDYQKIKDKKVLACLQKGYSFLSHFFNPDGSVGGEYGSRNSQYIFPHGLEILKKELPEASLCLEKLYFSLKENKIPTPLSVDDRYFAYFFMPNFLQAHLEHMRHPDAIRHSEQSEESQFFSQAKLLLFKNEKYSAIVEGNKCGILKIYKDNKLIHSDCGYWIKTNSQKILTNQSFQNTQCTYSTSSKTLTIEGHFTKLSNIHPLDRYPILFRIFNRTLQSSTLLSSIFNHWIKKSFILKSKKSKLTFCKEIIFETDKIIIKEVIHSCLKDSIIAFEPLRLAITPYSPTSHFQDFLIVSHYFESNKACEFINKHKKLTIIRTLSLDGKISTTMT